jgi:hypothetical protein
MLGSFFLNFYKHRSASLKSNNHLSIQFSQTNTVGSELRELKHNEEQFKRWQVIAVATLQLSAICRPV